ncbi:hypothetical protein OSTOST_08469 [Ostertagia ostertagi]
MAAIHTVAFAYLFVGTALAYDGIGEHHRVVRDPFAPDVGVRRPSRTTDQPESVEPSKAIHEAESDDELFSSSNGWGFQEKLVELPSFSGHLKTRRSSNHRKDLGKKVETTTAYYEEVDPNRNGLLKDIGSINVGFGVGVGVPGNDPVRVGARVGVGFGESGLAGQLPIGQDIYPRQGQFQSLNDYDGDKSNIVADRARKYWQAVREGRIKIPHYRPAPSLVGVGGNVGVGIPG